MPALDGIRGLAILGVLCSHIAGLSGILNPQSSSVAEKLLSHLMVPMWGGVDLFFVLSGFLITGILMRTKASSHYYSSFYARRILRIFPIYYMVLIVSVVIGHFSPPFASMLPPWTSWKISYFLYLQNWPVFWNGDKVMGGFWGAYWSLAVEEQFYFVWPLVILLCSEKTLLRICCIGLPCALILRIYLYFSYFGDQFGLLQITPSRVDGLLMGAFCSVYMVQQQRLIPMRWIIVVASAGASILFYIAIFQRQELVGTAMWMGTIGITGYALVSAALVAISQYKIPVIEKLLTFKWLTLAGKYSYGMYVYHLFLVFAIRRYLVSRFTAPGDAGIHFGIPIKCLAMILEMLAVFLVAKASYDLLETPFLRLKKYFKAA